MSCRLSQRQLQRQAWVYLGLSVVLFILFTFSCIITGVPVGDEEEDVVSEEELGQH